MHLYVLMRGHKMWLDQFINELQTQYFPYVYDKNKPPGMVQLAVRPIQLYELVFPKEHVKDVIGMVQPYDGNAKNIAYAIRKLLKLKPIPKKKYKSDRFVFNRHVSVVGVGLKDDRRFDSGVESL